MFYGQKHELAGQLSDFLWLLYLFWSNMSKKYMILYVKTCLHLNSFMTPGDLRQGFWTPQPPWRKLFADFLPFLHGFFTVLSENGFVW